MTVDRTDPYAVLGLTPEATQEQIRRAYRTLMRENHPDTRTSGDPADDPASNRTLQQAIAAYTVLGDPARRAGYDRRSTRQDAGTTRSVRRVWPVSRSNPTQPPIQAGPVRWHRTR